MEIHARIIWEISKNAKEAWLAVPIKTTFQTITSLKFSHKYTKLVFDEYHSYAYFKTPKQEIFASVKMQLNKIKKFKGFEGEALVKFLQNNKFLQLEKVKALAESLAHPKNFYKWIIQNIAFPESLYRYLENLNKIEKVETILKHKEAECTGKSLLFVALCRAIGIPARIVNGYFLKQGSIALRNAVLNKNSLDLHTWAEFFDKGYWVPVDCQLAQDTGKNYFGKFEDLRVVVSKDMNFKLYNDGIIPILQIGVLRPQNLNMRLRFNFTWK